MWFLRDRICRCRTFFLSQDKKISIVTIFLCKHRVAPLKTCAPLCENHLNAGKMISHIGWHFSHKPSQMLVNSTILPQGQYIPRLRKLSWTSESWLKCHFGRLIFFSHAFTNILSPERREKDRNSTWWFHVCALLVVLCWWRLRFLQGEGESTVMDHHKDLEMRIEV
jgi:hypothetical protein